MLNFLLNEEFQNCLKRFPELKEVELLVEECEELAGAEGWFNGKRVVVLFVPKTFDDFKSLVPIIYHELSHMVDKENPDKVFFERADEQSKQMWMALQNKVLHCKIEK